MSKKPTRSALGDISNRSKIITRSKSSASTKGWKKNKTSKPFSIAQTNKKRFLLNPQEPIDEVDKNDLDSPKYAAEYVADIFKYYKEKESTCVASPEYMGIQTDINYKMRALLIDWLCQVHHKFELVPATLYLTVSLLDRFLEKKVVSRRKLQLVGKFSHQAYIIRGFTFVQQDVHVCSSLQSMKKSMLLSCQILSPCLIKLLMLTIFCEWKV